MGFFDIFRSSGETISSNSGNVTRKGKDACRGTRKRRFVSWQPYYDYTFPDAPYKMSDMEKYLGYEPVWCSDASSFGTLLAETLLSDAKLPEGMILFESDDYLMIDKAEWKKYELYKKPGDNIEDFVVPARDVRCSEFIVKEFPDDSLGFPLLPADVFNYMNSVLGKRGFNAARDLFEMCYEQYFNAIVEKEREHGPSDETYRWQHNRDVACKEEFTMRLLPSAYMMWKYNLTGSVAGIFNDSFGKDEFFFIVNAMAFDKTYREEIDQTNAWLANWQNIRTPNAFDRSAYIKKYNELADYEEKFIKAYNLQAQMMFFTGNTIGPGSKCFCGSGKRFEQCHMNHISELL